MASTKDLLIECAYLRIENKLLAKRIAFLEKQLEELLKVDTSLKF